MSDLMGVPANGAIRMAMATVAVALLATAASSAGAQEQPCEPPDRLVRISGKIANNLLGPGETLGSGTAIVARHGKMHCGVQGRGFLDPDGSFGGFVHTVVCDDEFRLDSGDIIHSQLISITRFEGIPDFQSCGIPGLDLEFGTFRDISHPQSGRGMFSATGGGTIVIDGTVNCAGAIDMKYQGEVCVVR